MGRFAGFSCPDFLSSLLRVKLFASAARMNFLSHSMITPVPLMALPGCPVAETDKHDCQWVELDECCFGVDGEL